jgi:hypothetical protein
LFVPGEGAGTPEKNQAEIFSSLSVGSRST